MSSQQESGSDREPSQDSEATQPLIDITQTSHIFGELVDQIIQQPAAEQYRMRAQTRSITKRFGYIGEGFEVNAHTSEDDVAATRRRYQARRDLAHYALYPEGCYIQNNIDGETPRELVLLTPPDRIAVCRADGRWYRRTRNPIEDGPEPYTMEWYLNYTRTKNLPSWFMRPEHLACLNNDTEAKWLSLENHSSSTDLPSSGYLAQRYPATPHCPEVDVFRTGQSYGYDLQPAEQPYLSRRFPATFANATDAEDYRVYVCPSGHVVVRHRKDGSGSSINKPAGERLLERRMAWEPEDKNNLCASYIIEGEDEPVHPPIQASSASRAIDNAAAVDAGGLVNPIEVPAGIGEWEWLNPAVDPLLAHALGLNSPLDVTILRQNGGLASGFARNDEPAVVFHPDLRFRNPRHQPTVSGRWEYLTSRGDGSSRYHAWMNFGGQTLFPDNPTPSAGDIWESRYSARMRNIYDTTGDVDVVWIPDGDAPPPPPSTRSSSGESSHDDDDDGDDTIDPNVQDPQTLLFHQPLNRGENNQTAAADQRHYQSRMIDNKQYTVDRQRAHAPRVEPHKSWICTRKGTWQQWRGYSTLDWSDKDEVEKMNKWREQAFARNGWPKKRTQTRLDYTQEQRDWAFEYVKRSKGQRPSESIEQITKLFNERFSDKPRRDTAGIAALIDRLRHEYLRYNGQRKPHRGRGQNRRDQSGGNGLSESEE